MAANWRNPSGFDFNDVIVNTAAAKLNFKGKTVLLATFNSFVDGKATGLEIGGVNKKWGDVAVDLTFEGMKIGLNKATKDESSKVGADLFIDQLKGAFNEMRSTEEQQKTEEVKRNDAWNLPKE